MSRKYWLDLFTGKTWEEFLKNGANVSGFRERRKKSAEKIKPGDYFICYLTGISRFIGILEVTSECYYDETPIWKNETFPIRFKVKLIYELNPKTAIPVQNLEDKLSIFQNLKSKNAWSGFFRGSPAEFDPQDGEIIIEAIKEALENPIEREYDAKKYAYTPQTYTTKDTIVTIPEEEKEVVESKIEDIEKTTHEEIQWLLLKLGSDIGLDVWVARNDRNKEFNGKGFKDIPHLRKELPIQFDEATNKTIELIDVLWLKENAIMAAFEVEHTTAIYSGLLRMSDLISMQPNLKIDLYMVGPDDRREKVFYEINRPTFARLKPSLSKICKFIPYTELKKALDKIGDKIKYIRPEFIEEIAESCEPDEV